MWPFRYHLTCAPSSGFALNWQDTLKGSSSMACMTCVLQNRRCNVSKTERQGATWYITELNGVYPGGVVTSRKLTFVSYTATCQKHALETAGTQYYDSVLGSKPWANFKFHIVYYIVFLTDFPQLFIDQINLDDIFNPLTY